jgi:hypothetical protein
MVTGASQTPQQSFIVVEGKSKRKRPIHREDSETSEVSSEIIVVESDFDFEVGCSTKNSFGPLVNTEINYMAVKSGHRKKTKIHIPAPISNLRRVFFDNRDPTDYEYIYLQESIKDFQKTSLSAIRNHVFFYSRLENGETYISSPEYELGVLGTQITL